MKRILFVSSYPPRRCGIATFTADLLASMKLLVPGVQFGVCALNESEFDSHAYPVEVVIQIDQDDERSYARAASSINRQAAETVVIVQHEYGIYGGSWGKRLIGFLEALDCPVITTLHTVTEAPDQAMRAVTERIVAASARLVTFTDRSAALVASLYPSASHKIVKIAHGIHPLPYRQSGDVKPYFHLVNRQVLLTFGFLSRSKGIEYVIRALPRIIEHVPNVFYFVVGGTHPGVIRHEGEAYRFELMNLVNDLSLKQYVRFVDDFLPAHEILQYLQASDIYLATSLDAQQAVSGTLSYALGAGRAVIATSFAQAKEAVHADVGRVVPIGSSEAISTAVTTLLGQPQLLQSMNHSAYAETRSMLWSNIADEYAACVAELVSERATTLRRWPEFDWRHLETLTDTDGMLQFSDHAVPLRSSGYTLDDNSRALQVVQAAYELGVLPKPRHDTLSKRYLRVIRSCLTHVPPVNYLSADTNLATEQNLREDLSDSLARAYHALQTAAFSAPRSISREATDLLDKLPTDLAKTPHVRSAAQILLGATFALGHGNPAMRAVVDTVSRRLLEAYRAHSVDGWRWFDVAMTYANGQLCSSLLEAARLTKSRACRDIGLASLEFLSETCFMGDVYVPIGQNGWYNRDGSLALFDQQPEDPVSMLRALESAYHLTGDRHYVRQAEKVFSWFMGNNVVGARLYDDESGGCHDGLTDGGVNPNEGAESTLSYLGARLIMEKLSRSMRRLGA